MRFKTTLAIAVDEMSQVSDARRQSHRMVQELGFSETDSGRISIIATELATNLIKHGGGGEILLNRIEEGGIDIMAIDRGGGIASVERSMRDGYSTAGSPGTGLGAVDRLASQLEIYSHPGGGTVVHARFLQEGESVTPPSSRFDIFGIAVPYPGETICGDGWAAECEGDICTVLVVDGLGHGLLAADASAAAIVTFKESVRLAPGMIMREIDARLRSTRGAVAAIARVNLEAREVVYAGTGNISALIESSESSRRLVSLNGTLGGHVHKFQEFTYPFHEGSLLVLNSDGISTHWTLADYPGLIRQSPPLIAGTLYRDNSRHRDDATVVVLRERA